MIMIQNCKMQITPTKRTFTLLLRYQMFQCTKNLGNLLLVMTTRMKVLLIKHLREDKSMPYSKEL